MMQTPAPNTEGVFIANPANRKFVTGQSERIGNGPLMMLLALVLFLVAIGLGGYAGYQIWNHQQLQTAGKIATGTITDGYSETGSSYSYHLTVRYVVAGESHSIEQEVSGSFYNSVHLDDRVDVRYLQSNPAVAEIDTQGINLTDRGSSLIMMIVFAVMALIFALMVLYFNSRNRRFSQDGQFIRGQVTRTRGYYYRGSYQLTVAFTALSPTGKTLNGSTTVRRNDMRGKVPVNGTPVLVRYINDRAFRLM